MDWNTFWATIQNWITTTGIKVVIAIAVLIVSFSLINWLGKKIAKKGKEIENNKNIDKTLYRTLSNVFKIALKILIVLALVGYLGIDTSGITTVIASLGVGIGLAVNGTLSNFAGGVLLLITRPFKVDDYIAACGYEGTVEDILICNTKLRTADNKTIYLPNGKLSTSEIVNYYEKEIRRVDLTFSIDYTNDFEKAKALVMEIAIANPMVLDNPAPSVRVDEHSADGVKLIGKFWCKAEVYWTVRYDMLEAAKTAFDQNGISIPLQHVDLQTPKG